MYKNIPSEGFLRILFNVSCKLCQGSFFVKGPHVKFKMVGKAALRINSGLSCFSFLLEVFSVSELKGGSNENVTINSHLQTSGQQKDILYFPHIFLNRN